MPKFGDQIRKAVRASGLTQQEISQAAGIGEATLSRFVRGRRGISFATLDRLADVLDLHVTTRPAAGRGRTTAATSRRRGGKAKGILAGSIDDLAVHGPALRRLLNKQTRGRCGPGTEVGKAAQ